MALNVKNTNYSGEVLETLLTLAATGNEIVEKGLRHPQHQQGCIHPAHQIGKDAAEAQQEPAAGQQQRGF